jgi:hypothetical protein
LSNRFFPGRYPIIAMSTLLLTTQYLAKRSIANFRAALAGWVAGLRGEEGIPSRFWKSHGQQVTEQPGSSHYDFRLADKCPR